MPGMSQNTNGPLSPYSVLDLTRARSGPTCVRQLADLGASVIQVAAREGKTATSPATASTRRTCTGTSARSPSI